MTAFEKLLEQAVLFTFEEMEASEKEDELIKVLLDHPGTSYENLSSKLKIPSTLWDLQFGKRLSQRMKYLANCFIARREQKHFLQILTDYDEATQLYTMKPEAVEAFRKLGY